MSRAPPPQRIASGLKLGDQPESHLARRSFVHTRHLLRIILISQTSGWVLLRNLGASI